MENNNNRWFYNEYDSMEKEYKKDKKKFIRFIIRIDEDLHEKFKSMIKTLYQLKSKKISEI